MGIDSLLVPFVAQMKALSGTGLYLVWAGTMIIITMAPASARETIISAGQPTPVNQLNWLLQ